MKFHLGKCSPMSILKYENDEKYKKKSSNGIDQFIKWINKLELVRLTHLFARNEKKKVTNKQMVTNPFH